MYQIDNSSVAATQPASTATGTAGFFTDGNPATGTPATIVPAEFLNMLMMEMLGVLSTAGVTPSKSNFSQLTSAIRGVNRQAVILADTGIAGAYAAVNSPALTALPATGYAQWVNIAHPNPGAATYSPDGQPARPIYGLGLQALQGGELPVGVVCFRYLVQASVNSGNGAWIIIESLGGPSQIALGTASSHAATIAQVQSGSPSFATDTGTANTYVCAFTPAIVARVEGQPLRFKVKTANTGASTFNDGLGVVPLVGGAHAALQGGEMIANGDAWVQWNTSIGAGSYILLFCTGAAEQVGPATQSQHAMPLGQAVGRLTGFQLFNTPGAFTYTPTPGTTRVLVELIGAGGGGGGCVATSSGQSSGGSPGSGGGFARKFITSGFSGQVITIGSGGTVTTGAAGNAGGTTSFGGVFSATGGGGGSTIAASSSFPTFVGTNPAGSGVGGDTNGTGEWGQPTFLFSSASLFQFVGSSGSSRYGGSQRVNADAVASNGVLGAGGSGVARSATLGALSGGVGGNGFAIVYEYS